jgi:hypothetical protein
MFMPSLSERLRQGLASAVISAAAISVATVADTPDLNAQLAQQSGGSAKPSGAARPAARVKPTSATVTRKPISTSGKAASAGGCGATEGGCGPSR